MIKFLFLLSIFVSPLTSTRVFGVPLNLIITMIFIAFFVIVRLLNDYPVFEIFPMHPLWITAGLLVVGGLLSLGNSADPVAHLKELSQVVWMVTIPFSVIVYLAHRWPQSVLSASLFGIFFNSAVSVWDYVAKMSIGPFIASVNFSFNKISMPFGLYSSQPFIDRYSGMMSHPNTLGEITAIGIPVALGFFLFSHRPWRVFTAFMFVVVFWSNILSGSISGFLGMLLSTGVFLGAIYLQRFTNRKLLVAVWFLGSLIIVFLLYASGEFSNSVIIKSIEGNLNRVFDVTGPARAELNRSAINLILENPLVGYGLDFQNLRQNFDVGRNDHVVHNALLLSWVSGGLFAFLGSLWAYYFAVKLSLERIVAFISGHAAWFELVLGSAILGWVAIDMTAPMSFSYFTWLNVAVLYSISLQRRIN